MISNFLRSTLKRSSVHSGSGGGCGACRSSSDPGGGESVLRSLLEPWSDCCCCCCCCCCKYPLRVSHWAAMALHSNVSSGHCVLNLGWAKHKGKMCFCVVFGLFFFGVAAPLLRRVARHRSGDRELFLRHWFTLEKSLCLVSAGGSLETGPRCWSCELWAPRWAYQPTSPESFTCHLGGKNDGSSQKEAFRGIPPIFFRLRLKKCPVKSFFNEVSFYFC